MEQQHQDALSIDGDVFRVVVNDEDQYALWPADKPVPQGWRDAGKVGNKEECLQFVQENWTDMRPRSLREAMDRP